MFQDECYIKAVNYCINTLYDAPFPVFASHWERIDKPRRNIVRTVRVYTHGNPDSLFVISNKNYKDYITKADQSKLITI